MAILGVETALYGVDDLDRSTKFFEDFGLTLTSRDASGSIFTLSNGSHVVLRKSDDPLLPKPWYDGPGVRETVWGVDSAEALDELVRGLSDRPVRRDNDGTAHFTGDDGMNQALRVFHPKPLETVLDPLNAPGRVGRLNQPRRWRRRARPKQIDHVVFTVTNFEKSFAFFRDRLKFRLADYQRGFGIFARADGSHEHHNIYFLNAERIPGGKPSFAHIALGVEDIDEIMVGANHMQAQGWITEGRGGLHGLGRHRISSALFYYLPNPAGGDAEYHADSDYADEHWVPRDWEPLFGTAIWMTDLPHFMPKEPSWDVKIFDRDPNSIGK
jgi:catechol 2,3-dioxygenase-like lactoylglutathione lyase family enzyme